MNIINEDLITTDAIPFLSKNEVSAYVLRLDKIHPVISGNKWFKLKFHLQEALYQNKKGVITFGGAYSNHIVATAAACSAVGIKSIGLIRGEAPETLSHTLQTATDYGMQLYFLSRTDYKNKYVPPAFSGNDYYLVPEGSYSSNGAKGAATISYPKEMFDVICCATGTGTTMAGLINGKTEKPDILGFSILKNHYSIEAEIKNLLNDKHQHITVNHDFHFGGYAKYNPALIGFMNELFAATHIATDFVYTAKLFYGVNQLIEQGYFKKDSKILLVHSGGLQGNLSLSKGTLIF